MALHSLFFQVMCTALKSACNNKCDPSIKEGIRWLLNQIGQRYNQIHQRVSTDVKEQRAAEAHKRRERAERVRQIKEERERSVLDIEMSGEKH